MSSPAPGATLIKPAACTGCKKGFRKRSCPFRPPIPDVKLENFNQTEPGFLRITVDQQQILFEYFLVPFIGGAAQVSSFETFTG
jgi:hypothetical protein